MTDELYKMTVEELFDEYYWAKKDIDEYINGEFVFSHDKNEDEKKLKERYSIVYNIVEEVKNRINSSIDSYTGENVVVYDAVRLIK